VVDGEIKTLVKMFTKANLGIFIVLCTLLVTQSAEQKTSVKPILNPHIGSKPKLNIEEGGSGDVKKVIEEKFPPDDTEASGGESDDDEDTESEGSGSGSGSGTGPTNVTAPPTTTQTVVVINTGDGSTTIKTTTADITTTEMSNNVVDPNSNKNGNNETNVIGDVFSDTSVGNNDPSGSGTSGVNFTVAIIVGVVVGAILSILIIVFLVYRLRKKDEGSYSLDEQSSAMLRADTDSPPPKGKEEYYA